MEGSELRVERSLAAVNGGAMEGRRGNMAA